MSKLDSILKYGNLRYMKTCTKCKKSLPLDKFYLKAKGSETRQSRCKLCARVTSQAWMASPKGRAVSKAWREANPMTTEEKLFQAAKRRAKRDNLPCTISISDIKIPEYCPVLGVKLIAGNKKGPLPNAPSLDKIDPTLGYVPGNIQVISHKANSMKRDASSEELLAFANWIYEAVVSDVKA
jgi:hypothetical protein